MTSDLSLEQLKQIYIDVGQRRGWSFAKIQAERETVPWIYEEVVKSYLRPSDVVLDVGTGGGERFLGLSEFFASGIGIDPDVEMIRVARENAMSSANAKVNFKQIGVEHLDRLGMAFDTVLNRHASIAPEQIVGVLKKGGYLITQQVGFRNMQNFRDLLEPEQDRAVKPGRTYINELVEKFAELGCRIVATGEYDVKYWVKDIESLVFWLKAIDLPPAFNIEAHGIEAHGEQVLRILGENTSSKGIATNEHRQLLIVQR